jgi:hypothetical protein
VIDQFIACKYISICNKKYIFSFSLSDMALQSRTNEYKERIDELESHVNYVSESQQYYYIKSILSLEDSINIT